MNQSEGFYSKGKLIVRNKWVDFINDDLETKPSDHYCSILTLPGKEIKDIKKFLDEGLIEGTIGETGAYKITKGKVVCFEKKERLERTNGGKIPPVKMEKA